MKMRKIYTRTTLPIFLTSMLMFSVSINNYGQIEIFKKLISENGQTDKNPNYSIARFNNSAIVGLYLEGTDSIVKHGVAYIFERNTKGTWIKTQKLEANDKKAFDNFGISVAISGNHAIVGSLGSDNLVGDSILTDSGSAYFFEKQENGQWLQTQKVTASDPKSYYIFGNYVSLSGDYAIVNSLNEKKSSEMTQSPTNWISYIFKRENNGEWNEIKKLISPDKTSTKEYGFSMP